MALPLPSRYLTPDDLVEMFELPSVETVYQWRRKRTGRLPPERGGCLMAGHI